MRLWVALTQACRSVFRFLRYELVVYCIQALSALALIALLYYFIRYGSLRFHFNLAYIAAVGSAIAIVSSQFRKVHSKLGLRYPMAPRTLRDKFIAFLICSAAVFQINFLLHPDFYAPGAVNSLVEWMLFLVQSILAATLLDVGDLGVTLSSIHLNTASLPSKLTMVSFKLTCTLFLLAVILDYAVYFKTRNRYRRVSIDSTPPPATSLRTDEPLGFIHCFWISEAYCNFASTVYDVYALAFDLSSGRLVTRQEDIYCPRCFVEVPFQDDHGRGEDSFFYWASHKGRGALIIAIGNTKTSIDNLAGYTRVFFHGTNKPTQVTARTPDKLKFGVGYGVTDVVRDFCEKFPTVRIEDILCVDCISRENIKVLDFPDAKNAPQYVREELNPERPRELLFALGHDRRRNWIHELCDENICVGRLDMYYARAQLSSYALDEDRWG